MRHEAKVREILRKYGYMVEKKNWNRFESPDFWRMFDMVAVLGDVTRWVQVKSNKTDYSAEKKKLKDWLIAEPTWTQPCEIWLHIEGTSTWKIHTFKKNRNKVIEEKIMEYAEKGGYIK